MKVLLTGVAGFIGFHVATALLNRGDEVIGIDNLSDYYDISLKEARLAELQKHANAAKFTFLKEDISDQKAMSKVFDKHAPDKVCHLAAQAGVRYSLENPFAYEETNNKGTLVLLEQCRHKGVKHFVFASSSSVYGGNEKQPFSEEDRVDTPISVYAATKKYNEVLAHAYSKLYGIQCTGLRFFTVYGPWGRPDMALFLFTKNILAGKPIKVFNYGKHKRDFTYITDTVAGVIAALDNPFEYEIFNLARGEGVELMDYIKAVENELEKEAEKEMLPLQKGDVPETTADILKAEKLLNYKPKVNVQDGVKEFIVWYKEFYKV
ncbi:NAD-dependent epimerase/dehydratase family protein [Candidatus Woesearchaeota archaeon]|nr:NAD-dependent epimerase/dehydratase family protein [Candidatus Woesearchaeota archaeon]